MIDLTAHIRTLTRLALFFYSGCLLLWAFYPPLQPHAAGLMLGSAASLINAQILAHKIRKMTNVVLENEGKPVSAGFFARICVSMIAVMASVRFPHFDLIFTIIGLFFAQLVTLLLGIISIFRK